MFCIQYCFTYSDILVIQTPSGPTCWDKWLPACTICSHHFYVGISDFLHVQLFTSLLWSDTVCRLETVVCPSPPHPSQPLTPSQVLDDPRFSAIQAKISTVVHDDTHYQKGALNMRTQKCFCIKPGINGESWENWGRRERFQTLELHMLHSPHTQVLGGSLGVRLMLHELN